MEKWEFRVFSNKHVMKTCVPVVSVITLSSLYSSPQLWEGGSRRGTQGRGTHGNQELRKGPVLAPPSAPRILPTMFWAPL